MWTNKQTRDEELIRDIIHALKSMPPALRTTFQLSHYRGLSVEEIARILNITPSEAKRQLEAANGLFFQLVKPAGQAPEWSPFLRAACCG